MAVRSPCVPALVRVNEERGIMGDPGRDRLQLARLALPYLLRRATAMARSCKPGGVAERTFCGHVPPVCQGHGEVL